MAYRLMYGERTLFDPYTDDVVYDAKLTAKSNSPDYLDFTVPLGHDLYASVEERGEVVRLSWDGVSLFVGEVESVDVDMEGNKEVACVGALEWLNDTVVRPYSTVSGEQPNTAPSSVDGLFQWYVEQHDEHVRDSRKQFAVGVNQGAALDANNYVYRSSEQLPSTWDEISDKILDELGGYVTVDYGDVLTLNLYADVHETNAQIIDFGVNITDFSSKTDTGDMYTAVRPEGATPDKEEGSEDDPRPITIEGLADGYTSAAGIVKQGDVVYDEDAVRRYGYREYAYSNNDCTTAEGLLTSAVTKLQALMSPTVTVTVKAVDLALYMEGYDHLKVGQAVRVRSALHGIDEYLMVSSVTVDLQDPGNTEYTLGAEYSTLTGQQSSYLKSQTASINKALDTASAMSADAKAAAKDATDASTAAQTAAESAESAAQTAGKAVTTVTVEYAVGDAQTAPESGWDTATPTRSEGQTVWMRTVTATAEGTTATSEPTPVTGDAGDQGPQGEKGETGATGAQGPKGDTGATGAKGEDGKSPTATVTKSGTTATITVNNTDGTKTTATVSDGAKGEKGDAGAGFAWNLLYGTEAFPTSGSGTGNKRRYYTDWQERGVTSKTDDGIKLTLTGNVNDCIFVPMADTSGELLEASVKYKLSFTYRGTLSAAGMFFFLPTSGTNYGFDSGTSLIGDEQWHDAAITITTPASGSDGLKGCSMLLFYRLASHKGEYIEVKAKSLKLEKGTAATPWCTTQAETIGADGTDGSSVTAVKLQYAICDSSTTAPTSSWQDSVPDWQTGKYIWQRSATTIKAADGTATTQYGEAVLYGALNSVATSVAEVKESAQTNASNISNLTTTTTQLQSSLTQTADQLRASVSTIETAVGQNTSTVQNVNSYMSFTDISGGVPKLTLGTTESNIHTVISNTEMAFEQQTEYGTDVNWNQMEGTQDFSGDNFCYLDKWTVAEETLEVEGKTCAVVQKSTLWSGIGDATLREAGTWTFSAYIKASVAGKKLNLICTKRYGENESGTLYATSVYPTTEWARYSCTFTATEPFYRMRVEYADASATESVTVYVAAMKLERGRTLTKWTPSCKEAGAFLLTIDGQHSRVEAQNLTLGSYQWQAPDKDRLQLVYVG